MQGNTERRHPCLYFTASDVPAMKRRFRQPPYANRWSTFLSNAGRHLTGSVTRGPIDIGRTRSALGIIGITSFAYAMTGDVRYAQRAKKEVDALLAATPWTKPGPGNRGANLATGEACTACALYYDWCYDTLAETERADFRRKLNERGIEPYLKSIEQHNDWWINNYVSNWAGVVNGGCGLAALALYDTSAEARRAAKIAWTKTQRFLREANTIDGGGDEGVMYYTYGMLFGHYFAPAAARFFGGDNGLYKDVTEKLSGYWLVYLQGPDGRYANFNDMNENTFENLPPKNPEGGPNATLCALFESKVPGGDRLLTWAADNGGDNYYWRGASPFYFLFRRNSPTAARPALDTSALFREAGQAIWSTPSLWFALNGGWNTNKAHYNLDLGSFVLVANKERFVHDPGYGKTATGDHSTLLVNGEGQKRDVRAAYRRFGSGAGFRYLACDLSSCYGPALTKFVRHAVLVNDTYLVLLDDLAAAAASEFEWRLQTRAAIGLEPAQKRAVLRNTTSQLQVVAAAPQDARVTEGAAALPFVRVQPETMRARETIVTVLYPSAAGAAAPTARFDVATGPDPVNGILTVTHATGKKDTLAFEKAAEAWTLRSVNGQPADAIPRGDRRTLTPFRG